MPNRPRAADPQSPPPSRSSQPTWDDLTARLRASTRPGLYDATESIMNTESGHGRTIGWGPSIPRRTERAYGPMQIMPGTALDRHANIPDRFDWRQNVDGGARYFAYLVDKYGGDLARASAAYNAGPANVKTGIPASAEAYVRSVVPGWTPGTSRRFIAPGYPGGPPLPGAEPGAAAKPPVSPASPPPPPPPPPPTGIMGFMRRLGEMPGARADPMYGYGILNTVPANRIWPAPSTAPR